MVFLLTQIATTPIIAQTMAIEYHLDSIEVVAHSYSSPIKGLGGETIKWDFKTFSSLPQILSSTDPLRYIQLLPAVQTNADLDAGIHIYGCENMHNRYSIDGIPVFNPSHLLGLFSTFSAEHFQELSLSKIAASSLSPNIIGGQIDMISKDYADSLGINIDIGLIFSSVNLQLPTTRRSSLSLSARKSYLNWLYRPLLQMDDSQINYALSDYNLGWTWILSRQDTLSVTSYSGKDELKLEDMSNSELEWGNNLIGINWHHCKANYRIEARVYASNYINKLSLDVGAYQFMSPASLTDIGMASTITSKSFAIGMEHVIHFFELDNVNQKAQESSLAANWSTSFDNGLALSVGLRLVNYELMGFHHWNKTIADPVIKLKYTSQRVGDWSIVYNTKHQFLQQTRMSQLGLPIEFFLPSSKSQQPQYAHSFSAVYSRLFNNDKWHLSVETFFKKLAHQKEFTGNGLTLLAEQISQYVDHLSDGDGTNYGIDIMFAKRTGRLSGWFSLTLCRALRHFACFDYSFPASHERRYDINVLATYKLTPRLSFSSVYLLADGNPFTAPQSFYMLDGRILSRYGQYNANRLPSYQRLDLALKWDIPSHTKGLQSLNFSLYNVFFNENVSFYRLKLWDNQFGYRPMRFMPYVLPSLSYSIKF